jgi:hypothetical protein
LIPAGKWQAPNRDAPDWPWRPDAFEFMGATASDLIGGLNVDVPFAAGISDL